MSPTGSSGPTSRPSGSGDAGQAPGCQPGLHCALPGLRVLVAHADPPTAAWLERWLRARGCTVRTAGETEAALREGAAWDPDLLLAPLRMAGLDGLLLMDSLRDRRPWLPGLLLEEAPAPAAGRRAEWDAPTRLLRMPVPPRDLLAAVAGLACRNAMHGAAGCALA
jgi:CheY-like chemotaxis protein